MRRSSAPTLQDIASEVGVTAMTVSVVLNGGRSGTRVSEATRVRIQEAALRLGYRPNAVARGLSRRRMDTLGVAAVIDGQINLYFLEVLNGILAAAAQLGQNTTVFSVSDWNQDEARLLGFCDGRIDGLILIAPAMTVEAGRALALRVPFVTIHGLGNLPATANLEVDDEKGAYEITRYLIGLGHKNIAHFTGDLSHRDARLRLAGYRRALLEADLPTDELLVCPGYFTLGSGRYAMAALLEQSAPKATAVFCANDAMAYGAMETLAARGLRVPEDFSVAGFDDLLLAQMTTPHLTTVRQPFRAMGHRAVELLLPQIGFVSAPEALSPELFPVELVVRGSAGPPRDEMKGFHC